MSGKTPRVYNYPVHFIYINAGISIDNQPFIKNIDAVKTNVLVNTTDQNKNLIGKYFFSKIKLFY